MNNFYKRSEVKILFLSLVGTTEFLPSLRSLPTTPSPADLEKGGLHILLRREHSILYEWQGGQQDQWAVPDVVSGALICRYMVPGRGICISSASLYPEC